MTQYFFGDKSRRKLKDVIARVDGGRRSSRPTPTRRIPRGRSAGSTLRWGQAVGGISAMTSWDSDDWGAGSVQFYDDDGVADGDPIDVVNKNWTTFPDTSSICVDTSSNTVVTGTCETAPE